MDKALQNKITKHTAKIIQHSQRRVFTEAELKEVLSIGSQSWDLPVPNLLSLIRGELIKQGKLTKVHLPFKQTPRTLYLWESPSPFEVLNRVDPKAYFSHHAASYLHDLTNARPDVLYLNLEQRLGSPKNRTLTQRGIDGAHRKATRISTNTIEYEGTKFCLLGGKNTRNLGVESLSVRDGSDRPFSVQATNLERTLIDLATRPVCGGGPGGVLYAFEQARKQVNVNRLVNLLDAIEHIYPHYQSIGFYMNRSGYSEEQIAPIRRLPREFNFYLDKEMAETRFDPEWRIYVPADL